MPRLRNPRSGVVVVVDDDTAAHLKGSHEEVRESKPAPKKAASKTSEA